MASTSMRKKRVQALVAAAVALNVELAAGAAHAEPTAAPPASASASAGAGISAPAAGPKPPKAAKDDSRPPPPRPDGTPDAAMRDWFDGEHQESTAFAIVGLASVGGGAALLSRDGDAADSAGITFLAMGGIVTLFSVGYALPLGPTRDRLQVQFDRDPEGTRRKEIERMRGISSRFVMYRWGVGSPGTELEFAL